jgi:hypothetical protein
MTPPLPMTTTPRVHAVTTAPPAIAMTRAHTP